MVDGLGAYEPTCTPLATPLVVPYGVIGYGVSKPFTKYSKQVWGTGIIYNNFAF